MFLQQTLYNLLGDSEEILYIDTEISLFHYLKEVFNPSMQYPNSTSLLPCMAALDGQSFQLVLLFTAFFSKLTKTKSAKGPSKDKNCNKVTTLLIRSKAKDILSFVIE